MPLTIDKHDVTLIAGPDGVRYACGAYRSKWYRDEPAALEAMLKRFPGGVVTERTTVKK